MSLSMTSTVKNDSQESPKSTFITQLSDENGDDNARHKDHETDPRTTDTDCACSLSRTPANDC
jgi:hypothetical protein